MALLKVLLTLFQLSTWALSQATESPTQCGRATKPNKVFILTDDQDKQMDSLEYMQTVKTELIEKGTYNYLHPWFQKNNEPPRMEDGYATDLLAEKSYKFIDEGAKSDKPFFIMIATVAPHSNLAGGGKEGSAEDAGYDDNSLSALSQGEGNAPIPAERHKTLFPNIKVPRTSNFNPDKPSGASWIRNMPKQNAENVQYNDLYYRRRLQALQAVDDLVKGTIQRLKQNGILDDTYIIYSTDNGFHIGHHRLQPSKHYPYEEDINIPLVIRGPNIP
ncbi:MAG: hypothetical protein Q9221_008361 [Calogaya cf. arnoldii]